MYVLPKKKKMYDVYISTVLELSNTKLTIHPFFTFKGMRHLQTKLDITYPHHLFVANYAVIHTHIHWLGAGALSSVGIDCAGGDFFVRDLGMPISSWTQRC